MNGVRLLELDLTDALDVVHHLMVEDLVLHATVQVADDQVDLYNRARARADVEDMLNGVSARSESLADVDPETWGTTPDQLQAMSAVMAAGPPPGGALSRS